MEERILVKTGEFILVTSGDIEHHTVLAIGKAKRDFYIEDTYAEFEKAYPDAEGIFMCGVLEEWETFYKENYIDIVIFHEAHNGA